ncbi:MAG: transposase, partial [Verrucomicrobia bacterium]|nr:transposase [Deltaproteobacteria bacterium]
LCGIPDQEKFREEYRKWLGAALAGGSIEREGSWTESVAVGHRKFIEEVKFHLGIKAIGRKIRGQGGTQLTLREHFAAYNADFGTEKGCLSLQNTYFWDIS